MYREEILFVGISESRPYVVVEVRKQVRISQRDVQRVGIVRHRHELRCRRLRRISEIVHPQLGIVREIVSERSLRRPVHDLVFIYFTVGEVVGIGRMCGCSDLGTYLRFLVHQVQSAALVGVSVGDVVGIYVVESLAVRIVQEVRVAVGKFVCGTVVAVFQRFAQAPAVGIVRFQEEVAPERFRVGDTAAQSRIGGTLLIPLVDDFHGFARNVGKGLVESVERVVAEFISYEQGQCPSRFSEFLSQEQPSVGPPVAVDSGVFVETGVDGIPESVHLVHRKEVGVFREISASDIETRFEDYGSVFAEGMFQTYSQAVSVGIGDVVDVEYQDLTAAIRSHNDYIGRPFIVVEDQEFVSQFPQLQKLYATLYSAGDLEDVILKLNLADMKATIKSLPVGAQNSIKHIASQMISNGQLDSVSKIKALDELFGTEMVLMTGLFN